MSKMSPKESASKVVELCRKYGWTFEVRGTIFTIRKRFAAGSNEELVTADMEYGSILDYLPSTSAGSVWGTDCGGIGAISALNSGLFVMNKSGGSKRVLNELKKVF